MSAQAPDDRAVPALARGHRLQYEPAQECHVLLYPEGMVTLNEPAAAILKRCNGEHSLADLCATLSAEFGGAEVAGDVHDFIRLAESHGWLVLRPPRDQA